jgi:hypothetical protein
MSARLQLCEPKIRSLETDNRFTEAHLAIGSGEWSEISPLSASGQTFLLPPHALVDRTNERGKPATRDRFAIIALNDALFCERRGDGCPTMLSCTQFAD